MKNTLAILIEITRIILRRFVPILAPLFIAIMLIYAFELLLKTAPIVPASVLDAQRAKISEVVEDVVKLRVQYDRLSEDLDTAFKSVSEIQSSGQKFASLAPSDRQFLNTVAREVKDIQTRLAA